MTIAQGFYGKSLLLEANVFFSMNSFSSNWEDTGALLRIEERIFFLFEGIFLERDLSSPKAIRPATAFLSLLHGSPFYP